MGNRVCNQESRKCTEAEQNYKAYGNRGGIGDRSSNLTKLIGVKRVFQQNFEYEGTFYVTELGETYDIEYVNTHNVVKTSDKFYEISNWKYNEGKKMYEPVIRRIVMIRIEGTQLSLDL